MRPRKREQSYLEIINLGIYLISLCGSAPQQQKKNGQQYIIQNLRFSTFSTESVANFMNILPTPMV